MIINLNSKKPISQDIADQYGRFIEAGVFIEGEKLPSVRQLAAQLGINPNTVEKAYLILEKKGYVKSLMKKGFFVLPFNKTLDKKVIVETINGLKNLGFTYDEIIEVIKILEGEKK